MQSSLKKEPIKFSLFCWNIANPSPERAGKQAAWLLRRPEDVLVLTEARQSKGCIMIERYLESIGYNVIFPKPTEKEYGVMVISKLPLKQTDFSKKIDYLSSRIVSVKVNNNIEVIGAYIPSRGFDEGPRALKKKRFIEILSKSLKTESSVNQRIFCGDLNILEPGHIPYYDYFKQWEYDFYSKLSDYNLKDAFRHLHPEAQEHSWLGRSGSGYRYDHCFVSDDILKFVQKCYYLHEVRETKLSDHSAMILEVV